MHPYIPHLLADIAAAHRPEPDADAPLISKQQSFEEEMEEIENWCMGIEAPYTFGQHCGLEAVNFPPPEQLSNKDMVTVCNAFDRMLFSWNMSIDVPKKMPNHLKYSFRVATLDEKTAITNSGMLTFDYCSGNSDGCVFKQYCRCIPKWTNPVKYDWEWNGTDANEMPETDTPKKPGIQPFYDPDDPMNDLPF